MKGYLTSAWSSLLAMPLLANHLVSYALEHGIDLRNHSDFLDRCCAD